MQDDVPNAVVRAADARAQGLSWAAAAEQAGWDLPGLRAWIRKHRVVWHRVLGQARCETHDAARDEAVTMLRRQMRAKQSKTVISAATTLTTRLSKPKPKPAPDKRGEMPLDRWIDSLPEKKLEKLDHFLDTVEANHQEGSE